MNDPVTPVLHADFAGAFVEYLAHLPEGANILERVDPQHLVLLRGERSTGWVPFASHAEILRALWEVSGDVGFKAHYRRFVYETVEGPLLRESFEATVASFGRDPATLFRLLPRAVRAAHRQVVDVDVRPGQHEVHIEWHTLCPEARNVAWPAMQEALCLAILDLCHASADQVITDTSGVESGHVRVHVRWLPRRPTPVPPL